jgi:hypothetical protein
VIPLPVYFIVKTVICSSLKTLLIINEDKIYFAFPQRREGVSVSENQFHFATKEVSMSDKMKFILRYRDLLCGNVKVILYIKSTFVEK